MRRSRLNWAMGVIAPWCLSMGLLVSITADAGQNGTIGGTIAALSAPAVGQPVDLIPMRSLALTGELGGLGFHDAPALVPVSFDPGTADDYKQVTDEIEPRRDLKHKAGTSPVIDRSHKSAPTIGLRPTFDTQLRRPGGLASLRESRLIAPHDDALPAASFSLQDEGNPIDGSTAFSPWADGEDPQDAAPVVGAASVGATSVMMTASAKERLEQGATPKVSRAEAISSTTPAQADDTPVEAVFSVAPVPSQNATIVPRSGHPDYAALLAGDRGARERKCLAEAVYFESRSEPEQGQAAVAQVVLNRATSGLYPASICGVVYQNRTHYKACQFSFACEGKSLRINEAAAWHTAVRIADEVLMGRTYLSDVGGATHYHAKYVRPGWARRLVKMDVIGHHVFYKLHSGQT